MQASSNLNKKLKRLIALRLVFIALGVGATLVGFQNCVQGKLDDYGTGKDEGASTVNTPFAFSVKVDRFAYLSCNNMGSNYDTSTYFTYRLAAVGNESGLAFNSKFRDFSESHLTTASDRLRALVVPPYNQDARMFMSLRSLENLRDRMVAPGGRNNLSKSGVEIWDTISGGEIGDSLYEMGPYETDRLRTFGGRALVGSLNFNWSLSETINFMDPSSSNWGYLSIAFRSRLSEDLERVVGVADDNEKLTDKRDVYGVGFLLRPGLAAYDASWNVNESHPKRGVVELHEYDLETRAEASDGAWTCPRAFQFKVVLRSSWSDAGCSDPSNNSTLTPDSPENAEALRVADEILNGVTGVKRWIIDPNHRCVFPISDQGSCYATSGPSGVEWDLIQPCGGTGQKACVHFLSICTKN